MRGMPQTYEQTLTGVRARWSAGRLWSQQYWARVAQWCRTREGMAVCALFVAALGLRLVLAPFLEVSPDLQIYFFWGSLFPAHFLDPYSASVAITSDHDFWLNYPPLAFYLYALIELLYFGGASLIGRSPSRAIGWSRTLRFVFKLPLILADAVLLGIIYKLARSRLSARRAWLATATYAFSPGVLIVVLLWGQTDGIVLLFVVLGFLFATRQRPVTAGIMLALAVSFKPQPVVFVPLLLVYLLRWSGLREALRGAAGLAGTCLVAWLPYLLPPRFEVFAFLRALSLWVQASPSASHGGFTLWYLLGMQSTDISTHLLGPLTLQAVSTGLIVATFALLVVGLWQDGSARRLWSSVALLSLASFVLGTLQFERYEFPCVALFLLAAIYDRRYWLCYAGVSLMLYLNFCATFAICQCFFPIKWLPHPIAGLLMPNLNPRLGAVANLMLFLIALAFYIALLVRRLGRSDQAAGPRPAALPERAQLRYAMVSAVRNGIVRLQRQAVQMCAMAAEVARTRFAR